MLTELQLSSTGARQIQPVPTSRPFAVPLHALPRLEAVKGNERYVVRHATPGVAAMVLPHRLCVWQCCATFKWLPLEFDRKGDGWTLAAVQLFPPGSPLLSANQWPFSLEQQPNLVAVCSNAADRQFATRAIVSSHADLTSILAHVHSALCRTGAGRKRLVRQPHFPGFASPSETE